MPPTEQAASKSGVVIIGGGPAGLATALMLARRGWSDITLVERRSSLDFEERERSYTYMIDGRGRKLLSRIPGLLPALDSVSVSTEKIDICRVQLDGSMKSSDIKIKDAAHISHWLPRRALLRLLRDEGLVAGQQAGWANGISVRLATELDSLQVLPSPGHAAGGPRTRLQVRLRSSAAGDAGPDAAGPLSSQPAPQLGSPAPGHDVTHTLVGTAHGTGSGSVPGHPSSPGSEGHASAGSSPEVLYPRLVIAADGLSSAVRATLEEWDKAGQLQQWAAGSPQASSSSATAAGSDAAQGPGSRPGPMSSGKFSLRVLDSASAGLRYKVIPLPPNPILSTAPGSAPLPSQTFGALTGAPGPWHRTLRLGLLPVKDQDAPRTMNVIARPGHAVWELQSADELYALLQQQVPQFPARQLIPQAEAAAVVASPGGRFPAPQHCRGLTLTLPVQPAADPPSPNPSQTAAASREGLASGAPTGVEPINLAEQPRGAAADAAGDAAAHHGDAAAAGACGIVLLGDARGAFPPDLGQGVNSALEDVAMLDEVLAETGDDLGRALPQYEQRRLPQIQSLVELMTFCHPRQYNQDPWGLKLWTANFLLRMLLHKLLPAVFHPHSFLLCQDYTLPYSEIVRRAHETTTRVIMLGASMAALLAAGVWKVVSSHLSAVGTGAVVLQRRDVC